MWIDHIPHREFKAFLAWLDEQWNQPSRSDYYLMQIAQSVHNQALRSKPGTLGLKHFGLEFKPKTAKETTEQQQQVAKNKIELHKAVWRSRSPYLRKHSHGGRD